MGFSVEFLPFLDACHEDMPIRNSFLSIGSQEIHDPPARIKEFSIQNKYDYLYQDSTFKTLLIERYGIKTYADLDINGVATYNIDLGKPCNKCLLNGWEYIFNGGTLEHILNTPQALENLHNMCAVGGVIIHISPLSWFNHGFYNFTPRLYDSLIKSNDYLPVVEGYYFQENKIAKHSNWFQSLVLAMLCKNLSRRDFPSGMVITRRGKDSDRLYDMRELITKSKHFPTYTLYCVAYSKQTENKFVVPYDIQL